jgi:hypothetical protein
MYSRIIQCFLWKNRLFSLCSSITNSLLEICSPVPVLLISKKWEQESNIQMCYGMFLGFFSPCTSFNRNTPCVTLYFIPADKNSVLMRTPCETKLFCSVIDTSEWFFTGIYVTERAVIGLQGNESDDGDNLTALVRSYTFVRNKRYVNNVFMFCGSIPLCGYIGLYWTVNTTQRKQCFLISN